MKLDPISQRYKNMLDKLERKPMYVKIATLSLAIMENDLEVTPLVTLLDNNDSDRVCHIIRDDGCFVLIYSVRVMRHLPFSGSPYPTLRFRKGTHWSPEAAKALGEYLKDLEPTPFFTPSNLWDAAKYEAMKPGGMINMVPETAADAARSALKSIAKDSAAAPNVRIDAAKVLLDHEG